MIARFVFALLLGLSFGFAAGAQDWQRLGPPGGTVITLGTGAGEAVYLGTADGHVFAKEGATKRWELRGRVGRRTDGVVSRLLADSGRTNVLFAAIWYQQPGAGGGVYRSEDGGRTWKLLGLQEEAVRALEFANSQTQILVAGTRGGVFRSADEGKTWEHISPEGDPELGNVDSLAIDPRNANVIYAGTYHLPWKTTDGGKSWKPASAGLIDDSDIMSLRLDAMNPDRLFLSACSGIYRSENQGASWTKLQGIPYAARRTQAIVQDLKSPQTLYAGTTEGLWVTQDGGESWNRTTPKEWVINSVAVIAADAGSNGKERVLIGTESRGVLTSEDAGRTFVEDNAGFAHQVVQQLIGDQRDPAHLSMMMEGHGTILWESHDAGSHWLPLPLAKLENKKSTPLAAETVEKLYASPWGWLVRLANGELWILDEREQKWKKWKLRLAVNAAGSEQSFKREKIRKAETTSEGVALVGNVLEFSQEGAYLLAKERLLRCDLAGTCARLKAFGRGRMTSAVEVSADGSQLRVVSDGELATSQDGGQSAVWSDAPGSTKALLWLKSIEIEGKPSLFLGTMEGLFVSADGGTSWNRSGQGLPAGQVEKFLRGDGFLAATLREGGLYISRDDGETWIRTDVDTERSRFTGLVETAPGVLTIGSQSEGVLRWQDTR